MNSFGSRTGVFAKMPDRCEDGHLESQKPRRENQVGGQNLTRWSSLQSSQWDRLHVPLAADSCAHHMCLAPRFGWIRGAAATSQSPTRNSCSRNKAATCRRKFALKSKGRRARRAPGRTLPLLRRSWMILKTRRGRCVSRLGRLLSVAGRRVR
jgi:hypothetical protein